MLLVFFACDGRISCYKNQLNQSDWQQEIPSTRRDILSLVIQYYSAVTKSYLCLQKYNSIIGGIWMVIIDL